MSQDLQTIEILIYVYDNEYVKLTCNNMYHRDNSA